MTIEQIEQSRPDTLKVQDAAAVMGVTPRFLQLALQQDKFPFGVAVRMNRWTYYINTVRFIKYMKGEDMYSPFIHELNSDKQ